MKRERVKEEEKVDVEDEGLSTINEDRDEEKETVFDKEIKEAMTRYHKRHEDADGNIWYESNYFAEEDNHEEYSLLLVK